MSHYWNWAAGYVQSKTQTQLVQAIQEAVDTVTQRQARFVDHTVPYAGKYSDAFIVASVSFQQNGWTAFWNESQRFCWWAFKTQHLSGIQFSGMDEHKQDSYRGDASSWDYIIWQDGTIADWFISNPQFHFQSWGPRALKSVALPYLERKGKVDRSNEISTDLLHGLVDQHTDAWNGDVDCFMRVTRPSVTEKDVRKWMT
jgi:hypothetical protein